MIMKWAEVRFSANQGTSQAYVRTTKMNTAARISTPQLAETVVIKTLNLPSYGTDSLLGIA